ncbi:MOSC N-terminal beta barrel domain-containing protein [Shewanella sp.]|uniref:MOSC N-terminal beta barrel domain-containing protein n=1 Tax=Shewanella sp. TaxID=50422 RepID=UPI003565BAD3
MAKLSGIHIYPVKSMATQRLSQARVCKEGLAGDRRFIVVRPNGEFITARTHPLLQQIQPLGTDEAIQSGELWLRFAGKPDLRVQASAFQRTQIPTRVWKDNFNGLATNPLADAWVSSILGENARLLWLGETSDRYREKLGTTVSFADGYPLLLISEASLEDLNLRSDAISQMSQFRTNLVVSDTRAFEEDTWKRIRIGEVEFDVAKPCGRCVMTTVLPGTASFHPQGEPLSTLSKFRKSASGEVNFGQNLIALNEGIIREGDTIEVLKTQESEHYRNLAPAKRAMVLTEKRTIARDFCAFAFKAADNKPLPGFLPGQHLVFAIDIDGERHIRRYSLTHAAGDGLYHIAVKRTEGGHISNWLHDELAIGDTVLCGRPEGRFSPRAGKALLLISAGSGITPMLAMARTAQLKAHQQGAAPTDAKPLSHIYFIHQCRSREDIPEADALTEMHASGMTLELWLTQADDKWQGNRGRWQAGQSQSIRHLAAAVSGTEAYICGPLGFMQHAEAELQSLGLSQAQIHSESFGGLATPAAREKKSVSIRINGKAFQGNNQTSLLAQAEAQGISIPWSCRAGICGSCKCRLVSGEVAQHKAEALSEQEQDAGLILACCAVPVDDVEINLS